jgi:protease-4
VHVFRVGEYKSFSEPFTRNDMSEEDREATRDLLDGLWRQVRTDVAATRRMDTAALDRYIVGYRDALAAADGDAARAARDAGLVDRLSTRDEWRARLVERVGSADDGRNFRHVEVDDYLAAVEAARRPAADAVAVLVAQGAIVDGEQPAGVVGGDSFAKLIRQAREDETVKAVVLRIDSPGGSAWASELIRRELELTRRVGKPVIASMSSTAASGGYWIAAGANEIWAAPASLTGSIGIFAMFPEFAEPLKRLGISVDGVATAPLAGALDPRRPLDPVAAEALQLGIEHGYRRFLDTVAHARGMSAEEVDAVARGRVWTGATAAELGLVDKLGGLPAAVAAAAAAAGLKEYEVRRPQALQSLEQRLLHRLLSSVPSLPTAEGGGDAQAGPLARLVAGLERSAAELLYWNDPQHLYAHCLCEAP